MFKSLRKRLRNRIGLLLRHPQIHLRLDQLEAAEGRAEQRSAWIQDSLLTIQESLSMLDARLHHRIEKSMLSTMLAARDHTDRSVSEQQTHALSLAATQSEAAIAEAQGRLLAGLRLELDSLQSQIDVVYAEISKEISASSSAVFDQLFPQLVLLRRRLDAFDVRAPRSHTLELAPGERSSSGVVVGASASRDIDAALYAALEDEFRGAPAAVKSRQREYLALVADLDGDDHPVLDLGCGRGEWLALLAEAGVPALGIDSNRVFVDEALEAGLNVQSGDILEYLRTADDQSVRAITLFQVLEHLPFDAVAEVISDASRVLRPGGVLIAEVPNAKNLRVGAGTFWIDPTHERPWYPDVLEFLARMSGFSDVGGLYLNRAMPAVDVDGVPPALAAVIARLSEAVDGAQDYALVART